MNFVSQTDEQLVQESLSSEDAFAVLVDRYEPKLRRYVCRLSTFDAEEVDEVLQDTFVAIWKNLRGFDGRVKFSSWAYRIAHNQTISLFRKFKARGQDRQVELTEELFVPTGDDLTATLDSAFDSRAVEMVLRVMPEKYREILVLRFFEDLSYEEISDVLHKSVGTVSTLVARAKKSFGATAKRLQLTFSDET